MAAELRALPGLGKHQPGHGKDKQEYRTQTAAWEARKGGWAPSAPSTRLWVVVVAGHHSQACSSCHECLGNLPGISLLPYTCQTNASASCSSHSLSLSFPFCLFYSSSQFHSLRSAFVPGVHLKPTLCLFPHASLDAGSPLLTS